MGCTLWGIGAMVKSFACSFGMFRVPLPVTSSFLKDLPAAETFHVFKMTPQKQYQQDMAFDPTFPSRYIAGDMSYRDPFRDFPLRLRIDTRKSRRLGSWLG